MIYRNGKKIKAIFRNGKAISKIFRNGELIWQKDKPEAKRVKSIRVSLPLWGTPERIEWESILRAVPSDINGYYLDVTINGSGVRLRGAGGRHAGVLSDNVIELPSSVFVTTDELYAGMELSFESKLPSVTSEPTYKKSDSSYRIGGRYEFEKAPFVRGSSLRVSLPTGFLGGSKVAWTVYSNLLSADTAKEEPAVTKSGRDKSTAEVVYSGDDYKAMASFGTATSEAFCPSFHVNRSEGGKIGNVTLKTPACSISLRMKIISVETY
jgi:hypothetical protein